MVGLAHSGNMPGVSFKFLCVSIHYYLLSETSISKGSYPFKTFKRHSFVWKSWQLWESVGTYTLLRFPWVQGPCELHLTTASQT